VVSSTQATMKTLPKSLRPERRSRRRSMGFLRKAHKKIGFPSRTSLRWAQTARKVTTSGMMNNGKCRGPLARPRRCSTRLWSISTIVSMVHAVRLFALGHSSMPTNWGPVAQTFLSAGSRDIFVPCVKYWGLESPQNPQAGKPALPCDSWFVSRSKRNKGLWFISIPRWIASRATACRRRCCAL
jgi:hypothetical protein